MKSNVRMIALAAVTVLAACGDDGVSPDALTEAQATELASAIFSQSLFQVLALDYQPPQAAAGGPQLAIYSETVDATGPCPLGGEVSLSGSLEGETNDETGAGTIDFSLGLVHAACGVQGDGGTRFTLNGNPSLGFGFTLTTDGEQNFGFSGSLAGAVDYAIEGGDEGTCSIDYDFSGESAQTGFSFQTEGSICGVDVTQNVTVSG